MFIALIVLAFISPWQELSSIISNALGLSGANKASISISSKVGEAIVFIDDKEVGKTPFEDNNLKPGSHKFRLEKEDESSEFYKDFERTIYLEEGTQVVINWDLGPGDNFSSGEVYFFKEKLTQEDNSTVSILVDPESSKVYFDGAIQEGHPIIINHVKEGYHKIIIQKEGYIGEELEVKTKKGYDLFVEIKLFPVPIDIEQLE